MRLLFTLVAISVYASVTAQNTSPYWSLAGNSTATTSSKLGTTNSAPLRLVTKNTERLRIDSNGRVSIGMTSAYARLTAWNNGSIPAAIWNSGTLPIIAGYGENTSGSGDVVLGMASNTANARGVYTARRARGTLAAPLAVKKGDYLVSLLSSGYDGKYFQNPASIDIIADTTVSSTKVPAKISFSTGASTSTRKERLSIRSNGDVAINDKQAVFSSVGSSKAVSFNDNQIVMRNSLYTGGEVPEMIPGNISVRTPRLYINERKLDEPSLDGLGLLIVDGAGPGYDADNAIYAEGGLGNGIKAIGNNIGVEAIGRNYGVPATGMEMGLHAFVTSPNGGGVGAWGEGQIGILGHGMASDNYNQGIGTFGEGGNIGAYGYTQGYPQPTNTSEDNPTIFSVSAGVYGRNESMGAGVRAYSRGIGVNATSDSTYGVYGKTKNTNSYAGYFVGRVYGSGGFFNASDRKLKENIQDLTSATDILRKLKPRSYEYKHDGSYKLMDLPKGKRYGLIAQELEEVLPNLVQISEYDTRLAMDAPKIDSMGRSIPSTSKNIPAEKIDFKAVNYTELIPIMIKGMQEQEEKIEKLTNEVAELRTLISKLVNGGGAGASLSNASLGTANPNPVKGSTIITYNVPVGSKTAHLLFTDMKGGTVKQILLNSRGNGKMTLNTAALAAGTYTYSLHVDGSKVDSKQLLVVR